MTIKRTFLFSILVLALLPTVPLSRGSKAAAKMDAAWFFVEIETQVYRKNIEISSQNRAERRWYFSNVVLQPTDGPTYSLVKQKIMPYVSHNIMDAFEAKGFALDYGDEDVRLDGESSYAN